MEEGFFYRRLLRPILDLLRQGVTPEKMALSLALGGALGVFPALGCTTLLCLIAAIVLRLNLPAIQIVNYFVYPIQIAPGFRCANSRDDSRERLGSDQAVVDDDLARDRGLGTDRAGVCWIGVFDSDPGITPRAAKRSDADRGRGLKFTQADESGREAGVTKSPEFLHGA